MCVFHKTAREDYLEAFMLFLEVQSNVFNTDTTKGTEPSVRCTEVSVL